MTTVSWTDADFPSSGATKRGYVLIFSSNDSSIIVNANGKDPETLQLMEQQ
ncbi:MAG: hypothetical protein JST21_07650 [Bacteroidetes bacterium]|nr:hypothetical protein [Bacteroidota bacterium]